MTTPAMQRHQISLHGHEVVCHVGGSGPALLLIHGIGSSSDTWTDAVRHLAAAHTVIVPDLPGHGESDNPPGDFSLGAFAATLRDLLAVLGIPRATWIGHSLGGGIVLQSAYLFPELAERMVLVSSGGLGKDVNVMLRAATLPGSELVLPLITAQRLIAAGDAMGRGLNRMGMPVPLRVAEVWDGLRKLGSPQARQAFVHTARSVISPSGQRVSATSRLHLAQPLPTMIVWGQQDRIIPSAHGHAAAEALPHSRFELFETSGHFPHQSEPKRFARVLSEFVATTAPARLTAADLA